MRSAIKAILGCPPLVPLGYYVRWWFRRRVLRINPRCPWPVHGTSLVICPERVKLGPGTTPGDMPGCYIQAVNGIEIGGFTNVGPGVGIISADHDLMAPHDNTRHQPADPIRIGEHCWIGMNAVILPGVQLGPHTIVGAGAVVTKSFPEGYAVVAGNPAKIVRALPQESGSASS
jgi:acetyltransferase-like isoleucine patch superfamily enzyme